MSPSPPPLRSKGLQGQILDAIGSQNSDEDIFQLCARKAVTTLGVQLCGSIRVPSNWPLPLLVSLSAVRGFVRVCWLKAIAGAWCTSYRMHEQIKLCCVLGCVDQEDKFQHYLICPALWHIAADLLKIPAPIGVGDRLCLTSANPDNLKLLAVVHGIRI